MCIINKIAIFLQMKTLGQIMKKNIFNQFDGQVYVKDLEYSEVSGELGSKGENFHVDAMFKWERISVGRHRVVQG